MALSVHDATFRSALQSRIRALRAESPRQWGKMRPDQMLWHVNYGLSWAMGEVSPPPEKSPLPRPIMKFVVLYLPWPKSAPTSPAFRAEGSYDLEAERVRCLRLVTQLAGQPLENLSRDHSLFGKMSGGEVSRLQARHLDHHLRQFSL